MDGLDEAKTPTQNDTRYKRMLTADCTEQLYHILRSTLLKNSSDSYYDLDVVCKYLFSVYICTLLG